MLYTYEVVKRGHRWQIRRRAHSTDDWMFMATTFATHVKAQDEIDGILETELKNANRNIPNELNGDFPLVADQTERPRNRNKTCSYCGMEGLRWSNTGGAWKLYDPVLDTFLVCEPTTTEFDPCPQCGSAFCSCTNVYEEGETDET